MEDIYNTLSPVEHQCELELLKEFVNNIQNKKYHKYQTGKEKQYVIVDFPKEPDITKDIKLLIDSMKLLKLGLPSIMNYIFEFVYQS